MTYEHRFFAVTGEMDSGVNELLGKELAGGWEVVSHAIAETKLDSIYGGLQGMRWTYNATFVLRRPLPDPKVITWTDPSVFEGIRNGASWADPECDPTRINWEARQATAAIPFKVVNGRPVSPLPATSVRYGRNELGHWGEQLAADAVVLATEANAPEPDYKHSKPRRWVALIERKDGHGWAIPGGYVEPGEDPATAAMRELWEETGLTIEGAAWRTLPARGVPDPRASDEAWMVTVPSVANLTVNGPEDLPALTGADDAARAMWVEADFFAHLDSKLADIGGKVFPAHRALLTEILGA